MNPAQKVGAAFFCAFMVGVGVSVATAQPIPVGGSTSVNGTAIQPSRVTTASIDAGTVWVHTFLTLGDTGTGATVGCYSSGGVQGECVAMGGASTFVGSLQVKGLAQSGGAETAMVLGNAGGALTASQDLVQVRNGNLFSSTKAFAVGATGKFQLPGTDSTGTPGAATIDKPVGRSSIAASASSVVITNSLVTAATLVFIQPLARDATCLLPAVTTTTSGSFTVTTSGSCTAALPFNWHVVQPL